MSQKQRRARGSGRGGRRRNSSQGRQDEEDEEDDMMEVEPQTQESQTGGEIKGSSRARRAFQLLDLGTVERKVGEIVRYLLCAEKRKVPVKKSELVEKAVGSEFSPAFPCLMQLAKDKLSEVFGITVEEVVPTKKKADGSKQQTTIRYYILTNQIAAHAREALLPCSEEKMAEKGLLIIILALVMLKDGSTQEEQLWKMLSHLGIDCSSPHSQLGDVQTLIKKDFVEAKYLERDKMTVGDQYRYMYRWGPRAEASVPRQQLLALVAELHGNSVSRWEKQFAHMM